ncbi:unnamed protein product [Sympodiomycopsis kandeliae]
MVKEIGQAEVKTPEGYVGNLTDDQNAKLKETWRQFFDVVARAKGEGKGGEGDGEGEEVVDDPKKAGISKDDKAKEEAKKKEEEKAMNELTEQYGADALRDAFWRFVKLDDPDTGLLRFIRARKWDVPRAVAMFAGCMKWRLDNGVEDLVYQGDQGNSEKIEKFIEQHTSGKVYAYGASIAEHPVCYIHVRKHFTKGQPPETMQKFIAFEIESFRLMLVPPNDKVVLFFDLNGFGLKNMDWSAILYIVKCLEAYFPESLHQLIIYKAPWIFSGIWKILGPMLDPVVRSKVVFMSGPDECKHLLPADRLVEELGGDVKFDYNERFVHPSEDENDIQKDASEKEKRWKHFMDVAAEYEEVTKKWANSKEDDKNLLEKRSLLVRKLRLAQFENEFYARGKTQLHREGTLDGQGKVTWIYELKSGEKVRHVVGRRHCAAVMKREIQEMEDGKSSQEVEKKSDEALENSNWSELYGSEEIAKKVEGAERLQGKTPEIGENNDQAVEVVGLPAGSAKTTVSGGGASAPKEEAGKDGKDESQDKKKDDKKEEAAAGGAAAAGAAGAGGAAAAAASSGHEEATTDSSAGAEKFHDAPVAEPKTLEKAESKDHVAVPLDEKAAVTKPDEEQKTNGSAQNGSADTSANGTKKSPSDYGKSGGDGAGLKEKTKEKLVDAPKEKTATLGRRFSKLMGKGN